MDLILSILSGALWSWSAQTRLGYFLLLPVETVKTLLYCLEPLDFPILCVFVLQPVILAVTRLILPEVWTCSGGFRTFVNARDNEGIYIFGQTHPRKDLSCQI